MKHPDNSIFQMMKRRIPLLQDNREVTDFDDETIANWYAARRYVLDHINTWVPGRMDKDSGNSFSIAIDGHGPLVYSVVRHIALIAHFPNFNEEKQEHISTVTILYPKTYGIEDLEAELKCLEKEEYLSNLIKHSSYTLIDAEGHTRDNAGLWFLDIKFVLKATEKYEPAKNETFISEEEIKEYTEKNCPTAFTDEELTAAMLVNQAYSAGVEIRNLSSSENDKASRYGMAMECLNSAKRRKAHQQWEECFSRNNVQSILSCIFCSDTFEPHLHQIMDFKEEITQEYLITNLNAIQKAIVNNLTPLSKSEHARWNAEKLILGYRPLSEEEVFTDEIKVVKKERDDYRKKLKRHKTAPAHIDILGFRDLKRINPEDQKYDYFIMLAIPTILIQKYQTPNAITRFLAHFI